MQGFVSVPNRWSIIPPQKCSKPAARPFAKTNQTTGRDAENERQWRRPNIYVKDSEFLKSCVHLDMPKCGWGGLNCSPSLLSWAPRLSVTQTTSYTWLASGRMNTDAIKPTLCLANTYWQAFSQSSVCDTVTGERSCDLCTLQSSVCLTHTVSLDPIKLNADPLHPSMPSPWHTFEYTIIPSSNFPLSHSETISKGPSSSHGGKQNPDTISLWCLYISIHREKRERICKSTSTTAPLCHCLSQSVTFTQRPSRPVCM